jgi:TolB protein
MTRTSLALSLLIVSTSCGAAAQQQLAFERAGAIWIANVDGTNARNIVKGTAPNLSRDGTRIAFHTDTSTKKDVSRHIATVDIATKKVTVFTKEIPSDNCQAAVWSPDGAHILFNIWNDSDWHLALINADGTGFRYLKKTETKGDSLWSFSWAPDGRTIYAQDLNNLYQIDNDGKEVRKWKVQSLIPNGSFNSTSRLEVSPDGKRMVMAVDMDNEEAKMPDWDGPPPSVWVFDIGAEKATRLSAKGVLAWDPCWIDSDSLVFTSQTAKEKNPSIYRATAQTFQPKLVIKNAYTPSVSGRGS